MPVLQWDNYKELVKERKLLKRHKYYLEPAPLYYLSSDREIHETLLAETHRLVVLRFGYKRYPACQKQDEALLALNVYIQDYAVIYTVQAEKAPEYSEKYGLWDVSSSLMFFYRNRHVRCIYGPGRPRDKDPIDWVLSTQTLLCTINAAHDGAKNYADMANPPELLLPIIRGTRWS